MPTSLKLAGGGGVLLALSLVLPWFKLPMAGAGLADQITDGAVKSSVTGFGTSLFLALVLLAAAGLAVAQAWSAMTGNRLPLPWAPWRALGVAGGAALLIVIYTVISPPKLLPGPDAVDALGSLAGLGAKPQLGLYLALLASITIVAGALLHAGGPLAADSGDGGRLRRAIDHARATGHSLAVTSLALGCGSLMTALLGLAADNGPLFMVAIAMAIAAVVTARFARKRAVASGDGEIVYLTRFGQIFGWLMIGAVGVIIVIAIVALGEVAQTINSVDSLSE